MNGVPDNSSRFWLVNDEYHGVLHAVGEHRLSVSPNGRRYVHQMRAGAGVWRNVRMCARLSVLWPKLPPELAQLDPARFPDVPGEVARPWAVETEQIAQRLRTANLTRDCYSGVIAVDGEWRLVVLPKRAAYAVQRQGKPSRYSVDGWATVCQSVYSEQIANAIFAHPHWQRTALASACVKLPFFAKDYGDRTLVYVADVLQRSPIRDGKSALDDDRPEWARARHQSAPSEPVRALRRREGAAEPICALKPVPRRGKRASD